MKKPPVKMMKPPAANVPPEHVLDQNDVSPPKERPTMAKKKNDGKMNGYTKYSGFMENSLGLGRNGKRLAHGGIVAGGTWAAGRYGNIEIINNNLPAALGIGAAAGFLGTVALDNMFIDDEQEYLLLVASLKEQDREVLAQLGEDYAQVLSRAQ
jgi:hypothetical protein